MTTGPRHTYGGRFPPQLAAGDSETHPDRKLWHTSLQGKTYWCGLTSERTPVQLLRECESTIRDLLLNHPELETLK